MTETRFLLVFLQANQLFFFDIVGRDVANPPAIVQHVVKQRNKNY